jgi:hypothetical protein
MVTLLAISAPVALETMVKGLRQSWFWVALACCVILQGFCLAYLWSKLSFEKGDTAIILAALEMLALLLVAAKIRDANPSGTAAAEQFPAKYQGLKRCKKSVAFLVAKVTSFRAAYPVESSVGNYPAWSGDGSSTWHGW